MGDFNRYINIMERHHHDWIVYRNININQPIIFRCSCSGHQHLPLNIDDAVHIGEIRFNANELFPNGDTITYEPFEDGDECARLMGNTLFTFKKDSLQQYFNTGRNINPLTNQEITLENIQRCTYRE